MPHNSYREKTRSDWGTSQEGMTIEQLSLGCLLRIADAVEPMSKNYESLLSNVEYYKNRAKSLDDCLQKEKKRTAAYRGILGRREKQRNVPKTDSQHAK